MTTQDINQPTPETQTSEKESAKKNTQIAIRIFSGILLVSIIFILFFIKKSNPDFSIGWIIFASALLLIIYGFIFFGHQIVEYFTNQKLDDIKKIPDPITIEQARLIVKDAIMKPEYADYLDNLSGDGVTLYGRPKNKIYYVFADGYYYDGHYLVMLNMNYPENIIIKKDGTPADFGRFKKEIVQGDLEDEPDFEESRTFDPLTGREHIHRKVGRPKKLENKKKETDL